MEKSSARPYFAIFAIVAIVIAGFILKQQIAGATQTVTENGVDLTNPGRQLVETKNGRVPEPIDDWFKRAGWQKLGFESEDQLNRAKQMLDAGGRRGPALNKDHMKTIHELLLSKEKIVRDIGLMGLARVATTEDRKDFIPDVKALFIEGAPNQEVRRTLMAWCRSGDLALVKSLQKDPNPKFAEFVKNVVLDFEYPGKDV